MPNVQEVSNSKKSSQPKMQIAAEQRQKQKDTHTHSIYYSNIISRVNLGFVSRYRLTYIRKEKDILLKLVYLVTE